MFVRRPADVGNCSRVAVVIVWARVVGVETARAERIIVLLDFSIALRPLAKCVVGTGFGSTHYAGGSGALLRENLNYARERTRPIQSALRTTNNFNPVDIVCGEVGKIECALQALINRNAVEQNLCVLAAQSTGENRGQLAGHSSLHDGQARHFAQCIAYALDLFLLEIFRRDYAHARGRLIQRNIKASSRDDHLLSFRFARRRSR